jgi:hypothetical protein
MMSFRAIWRAVRNRLAAPRPTDQSGMHCHVLLPDPVHQLHVGDPQGRIVNKQLRVVPPNTTAPCNATVWASPAVTRRRRRSLLAGTAGSSSSNGIISNGGSNGPAMRSAVAPAHPPPLPSAGEALARRAEALMLQQLQWRQRGQQQELAAAVATAQEGAAVGAEGTAAAGAAVANTLGTASGRPLLRGGQSTPAAAGVGADARGGRSADCGRPAVDLGFAAALPTAMGDGLAWQPLHVPADPAESSSTELGWSGDAHLALSLESSAATSYSQQQQAPPHQGRRRQLAGLSFTDPYMYDTREAGRNPDGSCPLYPASHTWHTDVSGAAVHPRSEAIKSNIGIRNLHLDFGFETEVAGVKVGGGQMDDCVGEAGSKGEGS